MSPSSVLGWLRVAAEAVGLIRTVAERTPVSTAPECPEAMRRGTAAGAAAHAAGADPAGNRWKRDTLQSG